MNPNLVAQSLCFHGQPLHKIWEGERGNHDLYKMGLVNPDFSTYTLRQKNLTFQDRGKRLKLHQLIAKKAPLLFDTSLVDDSVPSKKKEKTPPGASITMPPYDSFLSKSIDMRQHIHHVLSAIQPGDIVYCMVISRSSSRLLVQVLCTGEPLVRYLSDLAIKGYVLSQNIVPGHDKRGNPKPYVPNDYVCCEVLDISPDADRVNLGMKGTLTIDPKAPLGLISNDQLPEYYRRLIEHPDVGYEDLLEKSKGFENPNCVDNLFQELNLDLNDNFSNMSSLKHRFPQNEYATELRQIQASKWAFRSVADGIENFKVGRHSEAFQCLNKALNIDPRNVEGLVARGALYANSGSFKKAVEDFETALKLNSYHANARKYMGETLVALGRSYEEENRIEDARKAYTDCLNIIPHHEEAKSSLEFLNGKSGQSKQIIDTNELLPALKLGDGKKESSAVSKKHEDSKKDKNSKKKKPKGRKRKGSSSSSSSDDSSESSDSSSSDSSSSSNTSSSSSDSDLSHKRKKRPHSSKRQKSLSPLSKRMALMDEQHPASGTTRYQFNQPFHLANAAANAGDDYDTKVRNFLEMTRDEDDYESRVRKLVEEVSKTRKDKKTGDDKSKKKDKKKKEKKSKKESKKDKKKKDKSKEKVELEGIDNSELKEALKIFKSLPMLDLGSKLTADLAKYEKSIELLRSREIASTSKASAPDPPRREKRPPTPPLEPVKPVTVIKPRTPEPVKPPPPKPPIVLDKFGCFRLAAPEESKIESLSRRSLSPPSRRRYSRSRSRSRYHRRSRSPRRSRSIRRSRSRSPRRSRSASFRRSRSLRRSRSARRSRSPRRSRSSRSVRRSYSRRRSISRRRRSRSRSVHRRSPSPFVRRSRSFESGGRRRVSRSRSRSYSRSRSRSPPPWRRGRRGGGPPFRGNRGFGFRGRGRGRGRGGFKGMRRSPPFRRDGSFETSPRENRRDEETFPRNRNRRSPPDTGIEGKWTHDKYEKPSKKNADPEKPTEGTNGSGGEENWDDEIKKGNISPPPKREEPSVEEIDKIINQAQKDRKEEIMQRDKDLLKKPTPTNLPF